jgi:hypothetical protein
MMVLCPPVGPPSGHKTVAVGSATEPLPYVDDDDDDDDDDNSDDDDFIDDDNDDFNDDDDIDNNIIDDDDNFTNDDDFNEQSLRLTSVEYKKVSYIQ